MPIAFDRRITTNQPSAKNATPESASGLLPRSPIPSGCGRATACKLAKVDAGVTAYALRHTCASWLVAKGLPTRKIADFLGTSESMIIKHYAISPPTIRTSPRWRSVGNENKLGAFLWAKEWAEIPSPPKLSARN